MIRLRELRFWTALAVIALSALTISRGFTMARFGFAAAFATPGDAEARLRPFADDPVIGAVARASLARLAPPADAKTQVQDDSDLLGQTPLSAGVWLDLAIARKDAGAKTESVAAALALSSTAGANEGALMAGRVEIAAPMWSVLPPDARRALIADLIGAWPEIDEDGRVRLAGILRTPTGSVDEEARAALLTNGPTGAAIAAALFPPAPGAEGIAK